MRTAEKIQRIMEVVKYGTNPNFFYLFNRGGIERSTYWSLKNIFDRLCQAGILSAEPMKTYIGSAKHRLLYWHKSLGSCDVTGKIEWEHKFALYDFLITFVGKLAVDKQRQAQVKYKVVLKEVNGRPYEPDAWLRLWVDEKPFDFLVEIERSRTANQIIEKKIKRIERLADLTIYKRHNKKIAIEKLSAKAVWLFVVAQPETPVFDRFNNPQKDIEKVKKLIRALPALKYRYLFLPLSLIKDLDKPVWFAPDGNRRSVLKK